MNKNNKKQAGFTLVEILVAVSIFATFIIMVTASLSNVLRSERKISVLRTTQESCRYILDSITREARSANGELDKGGVRIGHSYTISIDGKQLSIVNTDFNFSSPDDSVVTKNSYILVDGELLKKISTKKVSDSGFGSEEQKEINNKEDMVIKRFIFDLNPNPTDLLLPPKLNIEIEAKSARGEKTGNSEDTATTILKTSVSSRSY